MNMTDDRAARICHWLLLLRSSHPFWLHNGSEAAMRVTRLCQGRSSADLAGALMVVDTVLVKGD